MVGLLVMGTENMALALTCTAIVRMEGVMLVMFRSCARLNGSQQPKFRFLTKTGTRGVPTWEDAPFFPKDHHGGGEGQGRFGKYSRRQWSTMER